LSVRPFEKTQLSSAFLNVDDDNQIRLPSNRKFAVFFHLSV
jgi:hypothetical protein